MTTSQIPSRTFLSKEAHLRRYETVYADGLVVCEITGDVGDGYVELRFEELRCPNGLDLERVANARRCGWYEIDRTLPRGRFERRECKPFNQS